MSASLWKRLRQPLRQENTHIISTAEEATIANETGRPNMLSAVKGISIIGVTENTWYNQYVLQCFEASVMVYYRTNRIIPQPSSLIWSTDTRNPMWSTGKGIECYQWVWRQWQWYNQWDIRSSGFQTSCCPFLTLKIALKNICWYIYSTQFAKVCIHCCDIETVSACSTMMNCACPYSQVSGWVAHVQVLKWVSFIRCRESVVLQVSCCSPFSAALWKDLVLRTL